MHRDSQDDIQYERKLRLKRKLTWGTIYLGGGLVFTVAAIAFQVWILMNHGKFSAKLIVLAVVGIAFIYKGIRTFLKGELPDSVDTDSAL